MQARSWVPAPAGELFLPAGGSAPLRGTDPHKQPWTPRARVPTVVRSRGELTDRGNTFLLKLGQNRCTVEHLYCSAWAWWEEKSGILKGNRGVVYSVQAIPFASCGPVRRAVCGKGFEKRH